MNTGFAFFGIILFFQIMFLVIGFGLFLFALIDILRNEFEGNDKILWALVVLLVPVLGPIIYFLIGRSKRIIR